MKNINAKDFLIAWLRVVTRAENRKELLTVWRNFSDFTSLIMRNENSILEQVGKEVELKAYQQDYYSIDAILYKDDDLVPTRRENTYWFRDIQVAFEHENTFNSGLYQEVSHLLITNCQLKVLVAYPDNDDNEVVKLNYLHEIIKGTRYSKELSDKENFLIIFGYENGFEWIGHIYKEDGWLRT
jgi:hypothetical protein